MADDPRQSAQAVLVAGLRDAHAMERQAVAVLEAQLESLGDYPEFRDRVARHVEESRGQAARLEDALAQCDAGPSALKDVALSAMGLGQSMAQRFASDAPVKAVLADTMFEHLEIAAYRSLMEMAELAGRAELRPGLQASLAEEEAMAAWLETRLPEITRAYVAAAGGPASPPGPAPDVAAAAPEAVAAARPEAPLRDLDEFTDADPERADWPDGTERPQDRPGAR
jgi:ferritin-like metal-binding protein YciE